MGNRNFFEGLYTALITPFKADGSLDEEGFRLLVKRQVNARVDGILVLGSTGESPTLSDAEGERLISIAREESQGKTALIVGVGTNSTALSITKAKKAQAMQADGLMVVNPYYNKPTQEGLYCHFREVAKATNLPIILYNHPGRTGVNIKLETLKKLSEIENIVAVKDCSGSIQQVIEFCYAFRMSDFAILTGCDPDTLAVMAIGGAGVLSVVSNLVPEQMLTFVNTIRKGDLLKARELHFELMPIFKAAEIESNPIPIKYMMKSQGLPAGDGRLPLTPLQDIYKKEVDVLLG